ncbi:MAG: site-specific DNA-methyltransferase [Planctomycetia bacterium]|nr:site-specific DNA-methyltransferase [Planctomycetia bacterium]
MKERAPRNRTLTCSDAEIAELASGLLRLSAPARPEAIVDRIIHQDFHDVRHWLPPAFVDLAILDPPYNLTKNYNGHVFHAQEAGAYATWFDEVIAALLPWLRRTATVYVCSDWRTSTVIFPILDRHFRVQNRITWEREKGRGAKANWKNNTEDIWFCTVSDDYHFDVASVKLKRRVVAPYRTERGAPKDWEETESGNYRLTHPSNLWSDITVPFWSMPENTDHPAQKPEKLIAKLVLASSRPQDLVFDPFLGSGTSAVVAKKLGRRYCGIEVDRDYCCWALKRIRFAENDTAIQGYAEGVFWERNTGADQKPRLAERQGLFDD